ncbi:MAG: LytTR family transcriptional regulator DNA-binding domain-containing protein [Roseburia sp.]|nr:LytTR family transcriptional regulator DNA-binding domain-containing protein [Ruminococcus sp.]MCM1155855.1 LytTR family transcriptional regulator DNA-binding domain-containing protein [Roseburia sp.]MCM1242501.1 LytTR family transcriptional regulator DNA-binding domain-containing protein [Roseburia sp.]
MKIIIEDIGPDEEEEIIVRCREVDEAVLQLVNGFKIKKEKLTVRDGDKILQVEPGEIYYFEAVDNRVFLYMQNNVYETKLKLYELERHFAGTDFFRVSKSVILNLAKVENFYPDFNGRFEALMRNGERVIISRQYVPLLKRKLGI